MKEVSLLLALIQFNVYNSCKKDFEWQTYIKQSFPQKIQLSFDPTTLPLHLCSLQINPSK